MILTVDTKRKVIEVVTNCSAKELFEHLRAQYGDDWVNYRIVSGKPFEANTFIENHYHPEPKLGYINFN